MSRPLIITDCDEVLLHMVVPFRDWLDEAHDVHFSLENVGFVDALRRKACGTVLEEGEVWALLRAFFATEMYRQTPIAGALEALERLSAIADIVVLTNIGEADHERRIDQLRAVGLHHPVHWNQGGKGEPAQRLIDAYGASRVVFIDDLPQHHASLARRAPQAWRLHMVGEPLLARHVEPAPAAHARIDRWEKAERWIRERLTGDDAPTAMGAPE
mgnify:FL=1